MLRSRSRSRSHSDHKAAIKEGKKRLRSRGPKMTPIRASAKGEDCTFELPGVCNQNPETVVWCHENSYAAGKGMGLKSRDEEGAYGCSCCHAVYDGQVARPEWLTEEEVDAAFEQAKQESRAILIRKGLVSE